MLAQRKNKELSLKTKKLAHQVALVMLVLVMPVMLVHAPATWVLYCFVSPAGTPESTRKSILIRPPAVCRTGGRADRNTGSLLVAMPHASGTLPPFPWPFSLSVLRASPAPENDRRVIGFL